MAGSWWGRGIVAIALVACSQDDPNQLLPGGPVGVDDSIPGFDKTTSQQNNDTDGAKDGLCAPCTVTSQCAEGGMCLTYKNTGEHFCAQDCSASPCPTSYTCVAVSTTKQCVPSAGTCKPKTDAGTTTTTTTTASTSDLQHCVDDVNAYRTQVGVPLLTRSSALEAYAAVGAQQDSQSGTPHGHFMATQGGGVAFAENELPGWRGSIPTILDQGTQLMFNEGPGGGHYENMVNTRYTQLGCGIFTTSAGLTWVVQDFR